jgi:RNA methyltransferase, TrmH family
MVPQSRITSRQNPHVKSAARLRTGRQRRLQQRLLIEGAREIDRAIAAGIQPLEVFICDELSKSADSTRAKLVVESTKAEIFNVSPDVFAKLAFGDRDEGIVVVAQAPQRGLSQLRLPAHPVLAVLERIEKPGNIGAILRSADAAGIDGVIVADGPTDLYNPNTIRASLGTVFRPNVCEATSTEAIEWLREQGLSIIAARPDAKMLYTEVDLRGGVAIVVGSEAAGLSDAWKLAGAIAVRLPMHGLADSLNVSTTAAVLFYEALRQKADRGLFPQTRST